MRSEFIMNEETLNNLIEDLREDDTDNEIPAILKKDSLPEKWVALITSNLFERNVGQWERVDGNCLWVWKN